MITWASERAPGEEEERTHTLTHTWHPPGMQTPERARPMEEKAPILGQVEVLESRARTVDACVQKTSEASTRNAGLTRHNSKQKSKHHRRHAKGQFY